jgi:hypothetical protein
MALGDVGVGIWFRAVPGPNCLLLGRNGGVIVARPLVKLVDVVPDLVGGDLVVGAGVVEQLVQGGDRRLPIVRLLAFLDSAVDGSDLSVRLVEPDLGHFPPGSLSVGPR